METGKLAFLIVVNTPLYLLLGKLLFKDWSGFIQALRLGLTPNIISLFRGEWTEDVIAEFKLGLFFLISGSAVYGEYMLTLKLIGGAAPG